MKDESDQSCASYEQWRQFHLRVARGEKLDPAEQDRYEAGLREIDLAEVSKSDLPKLLQLRESLAELDSKCQDLRAKRGTLEAEISTLESTLSKKMRQQLGVEVK